MVARAARALAVTALAAVSAARADVATLAVAPEPGPGPALAALSARLRAALAARRAGVLDATTLRDRMAPPDPGPALADLERAHEAARAAYVRGDAAGSVRALREIALRLEALPPGDEVLRQWTRAMLRLGRTELNLGREQAARETLARLVRAVPDVEVDRTLYPASFARALERVRTELRALPPVQLSIAASAAGARVFVEGRDLGAAPVHVSLPPGGYRIEGAAGALRAGPVIVELAEGARAVTLDFGAPAALRVDRGPGLSGDPGDGDLLAAVGVHLGVEEVVALSQLAEADGTFAAGVLLDVRRRVRLREGRVRLQDGAVPEGGVEALAEFLVTGERRLGIVELPGARPPLSADPAAAPTPPAGARAVAPDPPRPRRTLGWVTLGAGVAAAGLVALGAAERQVASDRYARARRLAASDPLVTSAAVASYNGTIAQGDAARHRANAAWTGAAVAAVAAGILGYVNYRLTGDLGPFRF